MLFEVLVALVIAMLFMLALSRALGGAWAGARAPNEVVSALAIARTVIAEIHDSPDAPQPQSGEAGRYSFALAIEPLSLIQLGSSAPSAPVEVAEAPDPEANANKPQPKLYRVIVVVQTPSGRRVRVETAKITAR
jgi:hypothetical protein